MRLKPAAVIVSLWSLVFVCFLQSFQLSGKDEKLKPEALLAKHLDSLGSPEARAAVKNRVIAGSAEVIFRLGGQGQMAGSGNLISSGPMVRFGLTFPSLGYPGEQLAFDGKKVAVGQVSPGRRSAFSDFLYHHDIIVKEGLMFGALGTNWTMLREPKLDYSGLKKIEGKQLHEVKYRARKGMGNVQASLYFEPETFRHVHSQFRVAIPSTMGSAPIESASQRDTIHLLIEQFGDFKPVDGLTLPHSYKSNYTVEAQNGTLLTSWSFLASQIAHNQEIDSKLFVVQ